MQPLFDKECGKGKKGVKYEWFETRERNKEDILTINMISQ